MGNPRDCYEPVPGPMLDPRARQPRDGNHGHAVPNPRMRACSTGVFGSCLLLCAPTIGAVRGGGVKNCAPPLESEHESEHESSPLKNLEMDASLVSGIPCFW